MVLGGPDGPNLEKILSKIERMFEGVSTRQEEQRDRLKDLETKTATIESMRTLQDDMRAYVDDQNSNQTSHVMDVVDARLGSIRQGVMTDTERLLKDHLDRWMEERLKPVVDELLTAREEKAKAERDMMVQRWRNRITLGTAILLFLVSMWQFLRPAESNPRDYVRPIERLNDITQ